MSEAVSDEPPANIRQYVMVLYFKGSPSEAVGDPEQAFKGHMAYLNGLTASGMNLLSGPFGDDESLRGITIYNSDSLDEVRALVATDPAVIAGHLRAEVRPWFGVPGSTLVP